MMESFWLLAVDDDNNSQSFRGMAIDDVYYSSSWVLLLGLVFW